MEFSAGKLLRSQVLTSLALGCLLSPGLLAAQNLTVIGGTSVQKQLTACIEQISAEDLDKLPDLDHSMTIIILEHERFLQVKDSFRAYRTKLGFLQPGDAANVSVFGCVQEPGYRHALHSA